MFGSWRKQKMNEPLGELLVLILCGVFMGWFLWTVLCMIVEMYV